MRSTWLVTCLLAACGQSNATSDASNGVAVDAGMSTPTDAPSLIPDGVVGVDGAPMRRPCTSTLGTALSATYGRLDGYLVAIVPAGSGTCNGDADHIHLQILVHNAVYDVAVNVGATTHDVHTTTRDLSFPVWTEGWHPGAQEDYVTLGVHATDLPLETASQIANDLDADFATANHISIFATGYGPDGTHLVHRNGSSHDGLIVTQPLSSVAHTRMFSFTNQSF
ncbi:MAG: hypothetical protein ABI704_00530 [Kofleriaceae bacterium]